MQDVKQRNEIILRAIEGKMERSLDCPLHGATTWSVQEQTTALPALDDPRMPPYFHAQSFPLAVVICDRCGYTFFVNLIRLGLAEELDLPEVVPSQ